MHTTCILQNQILPRSFLMSLIISLSYLFVFAWYPALVLYLCVLMLLAFEEEALEHDVMTNRAVASQNLGMFLFGSSDRFKTIFTLYLIGAILSIAQPITAVGVVIWSIFLATKMDYGQVIEDDDYIF